MIVSVPFAPAAVVYKRVFLSLRRQLANYLDIESTSIPSTAMHILHLLLVLALAMFTAGAPAANSVDVKRQFPPIDPNKILVRFTP